MQPDPLGLTAGKNPFNYVNGSPLSGSDSTGLYTELIHIIDNTRAGGYIDHIALNVSGKIYEILPAGFAHAYISGGIALGSSISPTGLIDNTRDKFFANYYDKNLEFESLTLDTGLAQEEAIEAYFQNATAFDRTQQRFKFLYNFSFLPGGMTCSTGAENALAYAGLPKLTAIYPQGMFNEVATSSGYAPYITQLSIAQPLNKQTIALSKALH